jgi:filamentous hemagglutinin family protein
VNTLPIVVENLNKFSQFEMTAEEQYNFALKAVEARFGEEKQLPDYEINNLLLAERREDEGNSVWVVLNRVQEKLTSGGFGYLNARGKVRKSRAVKNFTQDLSMNQKLWELAEEFIAA